MRRTTTPKPKRERDEVLKRILRRSAGLNDVRIGQVRKAFSNAGAWGDAVHTWIADGDAKKARHCARKAAHWYAAGVQIQQAMKEHARATV